MEVDFFYTFTHLTNLMFHRATASNSSAPKQFQKIVL